MLLMNSSLAYIIGLLLTDGNVYKNTISIELQAQDKDILYKIADFIGGKVTSRLEEKYFKWRINSAKLVKDLSDFNIRPNKTFTIRLPYIQDFSKPLLRGCFDGDGSFYLHKNGPRAEFCSANKLFIQDIIHAIYHTCGIHKVNIREKWRKDRNKPLYTCCYYTNDALKLHQELYQDATWWYIDRKKKTLDQYQKQYKKRWSEEDKDKVKELLKAGYHTGQIAKLLPYKSYKAISKKVWEFRQE
jgi:hypothetical protein